MRRTVSTNFVFPRLGSGTPKASTVKLKVRNSAGVRPIRSPNNDAEQFTAAVTDTICGDSRGTTRCYQGGALLMTLLGTAALLTCASGSSWPFAALLTDLDSNVWP